MFAMESRFWLVPCEALMWWRQQWGALSNGTSGPSDTSAAGVARPDLLETGLPQGGEKRKLKRGALGAAFFVGGWTGMIGMKFAESKGTTDLPVVPTCRNYHR
jgi:hypothetical protein